VPPQAPVQPMKVAPVPGVASSVTDVFWAKVAVQMLAPPPQLIELRSVVTRVESRAW